MASLQFSDSGRRTTFADLRTALLDYADRVEELRSPENVLNELHAVTTRHLPLPVLGAARFPLKSGDWESVKIGKSAFLHNSVPDGWWEEYSALARGRFQPLLFLAATSMAIHTWTEVRRMFQPIGVDKWAYDVALKHGMRDGLTCPVGGRWAVAILVAQRPLQHSDATNAGRNLRRGQLRGTTPGPTCRS